MEHDLLHVAGYEVALSLIFKDIVDGFRMFLTNGLINVSLNGLHRLWIVRA